MIYFRVSPGIGGGGGGGWRSKEDAMERKEGKLEDEIKYACCMFFFPCFSYNAGSFEDS